jgi:hypothetical protein
MWETQNLTTLQASAAWYIPEDSTVKHLSLRTVDTSVLHLTEHSCAWDLFKLSSDTLCLGLPNSVAFNHSCRLTDTPLSPRPVELFACLQLKNHRRAHFCSFQWCVVYWFSTSLACCAPPPSPRRLSAPLPSLSTFRWTPSPCFLPFPFAPSPSIGLVLCLHPTNWDAKLNLLFLHICGTDVPEWNASVESFARLAKW